MAPRIRWTDSEYERVVEWLLDNREDSTNVTPSEIAEAQSLVLRPSRIRPVTSHAIHFFRSDMGQRLGLKAIPSKRRVATWTDQETHLVAAWLVGHNVNVYKHGLRKHVRAAQAAVLPLERRHLLLKIPDRLIEAAAVLTTQLQLVPTITAPVVAAAASIPEVPTDRYLAAIEANTKAQLDLTAGIVLLLEQLAAQPKPMTDAAVTTLHATTTPRKKHVLLVAANTDQLAAVRTEFPFWSVIGHHNDHNIASLRKKAKWADVIVQLTKFSSHVYTDQLAQHKAKVRPVNGATTEMIRCLRMWSAGGGRST